MSWKRFPKPDRQYLTPHHHYQMTIIFLFVFGFFLLWPYYEFLHIFELDTNVWQWYFFVPWIILYVSYCLYQRSKIPINEKRDPLKRPIIHWVILGVVLVYVHTEPKSLESAEALDVSFSIFTLFLADSYWDFKKLKLFRRTSVD